MMAGHDELDRALARRAAQRADELEAALLRLYRATAPGELSVIYSHPELDEARQDVERLLPPAHLQPE